jgi:hypothetical protein
MDLNRVEIEELEEQLVLLYRFISQNNTLKKFYYEGVDIKPAFDDETGLLTKLIELEDAEDILKNCIMELEETKEEDEKLYDFNEVLHSYDTEILYHKYGMSGVEDVDKLDIKKIVSSL